MNNVQKALEEKEEPQGFSLRRFVDILVPLCYLGSAKGSTKEIYF